MPYYDWAIENSVVRIQICKGLPWNQASKSISSCIEYSLVWDRFPGHGFDTISGDENVGLLFYSILENEFDRIVPLLEIDETVR